MGACASRPKELDYPKAQLPGELPSTNQEPAVEDVKAETAVAEVKAEAAEEENKNDGGEGQVEEPLVDLSSPKESNTDKEVSDDTNNAVAELVSAVTAKQTQENEDNVAGNEINEAPKEDALEQPKPTAETTEVVKAESLAENDKPSVAST